MVETSIIKDGGNTTDPALATPVPVKKKVGKGTAQPLRRTGICFYILLPENGLLMK